MKNIDAQILKFDDLLNNGAFTTNGVLLEEMYDVIKRQQKQMQEWEYDADLLLPVTITPLNLRGAVYNDKKKRFVDGTFIHTTSIRFFRTRNTTYRIITEKPVKKKQPAKKNPVAKALKSPHLKPKVKPSAKVYKRKPKHKGK